MRPRLEPAAEDAGEALPSGVAEAAEVGADVALGEAKPLAPGEGEPYALVCPETPVCAL